MPSREESDLLFVYGVPMPSFSKSFAITTAAFFFCCFAILLFKLGYTRSINSMIHDPLLWLILVAMCGVPFVFMLVLAFPPMSWLARIEISNEGIRYFPRPILRWMGEPTTKVQVGTDVQEILICQGTQDRYNGFSAHPCGYRIIVRSKGGNTQELKVATGDRLNVRQARVLSDGITTAIGAPVRFVRRAVSETGVPHEISWTPVARSVNFAGFAKLAFFAVPFIGGLAVGIIRPKGITVIAVGVGLWLLQTLAIFISATISKQWSKFGVFYWLTTAVSFAGAYAVVFLLTANVLHGR